MDYFKGIKTLLVLKMKYRELCKEHHPDLGGDTKTMQMINVQYERALRWVNDSEGKRLDPDAIRVEKDLMEVINKIVALQGILIEVTGRWIWVTGETKQYKDYFRKCGLWWASKKEAWYWRPANAKCTSKHSMSFAHIRNKYGSTNIETVSLPSLT